MSIIDVDDKRLSYLALDKATTPPAGLIEHIKDSWWIVHPERGLVFYKRYSPQCNSNESITRRIAGMYPWAKVRFIPSVFRRINPHDYV